MTLSLTSTAFAPNGSIPAAYTSDGQDRSPPLAWSGAPAGTKSFALIVDDPDAPDPKAPQRVWVHWVLYNLPADTTGLPEGVSRLPAGTREGKNDWHKTGYGGPSPPVGRHRYFFKLYALDGLLALPAGATKAQLVDAMRGRQLAEGRLVGAYGRESKKG
jgi:hypothetical protein